MIGAFAYALAMAGDGGSQWETVLQDMPFDATSMIRQGILIVAISAIGFAVRCAEARTLRRILRILLHGTMIVAAANLSVVDEGLSTATCLFSFFVIVAVLALANGENRCFNAKQS